MNTMKFVCLKLMFIVNGFSLYKFENKVHLSYKSLLELLNSISQGSRILADSHPSRPGSNSGPLTFLLINTAVS